MPPEDAFQPLQEVINSLSSKKSSPLFQPHITLLSLAPSHLDNYRTALPPQLPSAIPVQYEAVQAGSTYFQSILIKINYSSSDSNVLRKVYEDTLKWTAETGIGRDTSFIKGGADGSVMLEYNPHLSLFYGDLGTSEKQELIADMQKQGHVVPEDGKVTVAGKNGFDVKEVWIVRTEGPIDDWKILEKITLG